MTETSVNEKIREIISYYKLSDRQFSIKIGVTQSVIGSMFQKNTEPSSKVIRLTLNAFTDISADWLLRNKGPMLISEIKPDRMVFHHQFALSRKKYFKLLLLPLVLLL